jgi:hypothetical protein
MNTMKLALATGMLALASLAVIPSASAAPPNVCLTGSTNCVEVLPPPYCLAAYHPSSNPAATNVYAGCLYPSGTCAAATYVPATNKNVGIGCVSTQQPGGGICVAVVDSQYTCV